MKQTIVATDYKDKKNWNLAMQQFDLPTEVLCDKPARRTDSHPSGLTQIPSWLPRTGVVFACALVIGNLPLQSSHNTKASYSHHFVSPPQVAIEQTSSIKKATLNSIEPEASSNRRVTLTESLNLPQSPITVFSVEDNTSSSDTHNTDNWKTHIVKTTDNVTKIFTKLGIKSELEALTSASNIKSQLEKLSKGDIIRIEKIDGELTQLISYKPDTKNSFVIRKDQSGYKGRSTPHIIETRQGRTTLFIKHSLRYDANQEHISRKLIKQFVKIFNRDLNLTSDLKKGDRVTIVFEEIFHKGNKIASNDILAAELIHNKRTHRAIRYIQKDNTVKYLDSEGRDLSKAFKRRSLAQYKKISSPFGSRRHPISKRIRAHNGTDYAARKGTPITATGNGTISHIARKGGYGKTIIIKHRDGYTTLYGHMSDYAKGMKQGKKVYLGDVIGYVGSTGYSTGPHLHYEFHHNGEPKNPEKVHLPNSLSLTQSQQKQFKVNSLSLVRQLDVLQRFAQENVDITSGFGG